MRSALLALALFLFQAPQPQAPASIEGMVVRIGTGQPVAGAGVTIGTAQTLTDEAGRFAFRNLPPGRYRVYAHHKEYMPAQYGERGRGGPGGEITVGAGQAVTDIFLALVPNGVVSGRVTDRRGDAVKDAAIQALKYTYQDGRRILVPVSDASTDRLGQYRLLWLAPGPYIIRAAPPKSTGSDSGLPVYFPGTLDASTASVIDVPPGVDFTGVDLKLTESRAVSLRGDVASGLTGQAPFRPSITLVPRRGTVATGTLQRAEVSSTGRFEFRSIAPGSYDVVASAPDAGSGRLAATAAVEIGGTDIDSLNLVLLPQLSIEGGVSVENMQADPTILKLTRTRIELRREPFTPELLILLPNVAADGAFTFAGVTPGDYRLKVNTGALKGYIKSARFGAIDALNPPFRIDGPGQFEIVISLNSASLNAVVLDDMQKPAPGATVVLVPDPPYRQRFDLYYASDSNASGRVHFDSVAPGDYRMFAWDEVPGQAWEDQDYLRLHEHRGKPVRISEGSTQNVELKLISQP